MYVIKLTTRKNSLYPRCLTCVCDQAHYKEKQMFDLLVYVDKTPKFIYVCLV